MEDFFEVVLVSNENSNSFPDNRNFSFSNYIFRPVNLKEYQVALNYISFYDRYSETASSNALAVAEAVDENNNVPDTFFNLEAKENEIFIETMTLDETGIDKYSERFDNFINQLNVKVKGLKLIFQISFKAGEFDFLQMTYTGIANRDLEINEPLNRLLGFTPTRFKPGTYRNDKEPDLELFSNYKFLQRIGEINLYLSKRSTIELDQIEANPLASTITVELVRALAAKNISASFRVLKKQQAIEFETGPLLRVMLSEKLNNYLGLEKNFIFHNEGTVKIPQKLVFSSNEFVEPDLKQVVQTIRDSATVLVTCNILSPQSYAGRELQLLSIIDRIPSVEMQKNIFRAPYLIFKDLLPERRDQISVSLLTEQLLPLEYTSHPTFISLYFRKRE